MAYRPVDPSNTMRIRHSALRFMVPTVLALGLQACSDVPDTPPKAVQAPAPVSGAYWVTVQGTIRYVALGPDGSRVVIETEQGQIYTVVLLDKTPPVWEGLRGVFAYESAGNENKNGLWKNFVVKQH